MASPHRGCLDGSVHTHHDAPVSKHATRDDPFRALLGTSGALAAVRAFGVRAAAVQAPVLLTGESGTGKGLLARAIHQASSRADAEFVAVNCAGVPETLFESEFFGHVRGAFTGAGQAHRGLLEQAHGGTLFLDEIGELPPAMQAKLLTVLDDGLVRRIGAERVIRTDARIIAATNADLDQAVARGAFRRDLLFRLLVLTCEIPPLRRRDGDIAFLARIFLARHRERHRRPAHAFEPSALEALERYAWPGNVRELEHAIESAVLACDGPRLGTRHLPGRVVRDRVPAARHSRSGRYRFHGTPDEERQLIRDALARCRGNRTRAAQQLGMSRTTLRARMRSLGIDD